MLIRLAIILLLFAGLYWFFGRYRSASPSERNALLRNSLLWGVAIVCVILAVSGRIHWLFAILGAASVWLNRLLTAKRLWDTFKTSKQDKQQTQGNTPATQINMSLEEAYETLGLTPPSDRQTIISTHRTLINRLHPDKGGNDYLASKINDAKSIILQQLDNQDSDSS